MTKAKDDLEAVRIVTEALEGFGPPEQERIIRWSREKLGLTATNEEVASARVTLPSTQSPGAEAQPQGNRRSQDIQTFVRAKNPRTDSQFAAAVAYYFRFEAPESERKEAITKDILQEACRKVGRERFGNPLATLFNTFKGGLLDKGPDKGTFKINSVGENLVAMALPGGEASTSATPAKPRKGQSKQRARGRKPR